MDNYLTSPGVFVQTCVIFLVIVAPLYLVFRWFVGLIRQAYGFADEPEDDGPPLRICGSCHNTVLERDFQHCPYCGAPLPGAEDAEAEGGADTELG